MTYVILLLLALAFWHWIYESVLAPSFRQVMKLELRALQAELASLEGRSLDPRCRGAFQALSDSLGTLGLFMSRLDVVTLAAVEVEIRRNPGLRELAESRAALFQSCDVKVLRDLRNRSLRLAARAVAVNSGAWCVFVVPLVLARTGMRGARRLVAAALVLSRSDLGRLASNFSPAPL